MNYIDTLLTVISESYKNYLTHGARSKEKIKPLHKGIAKIIGEIWGEDFKMHYLGEKGENLKELKVEGQYYKKDIDLTVTHNNKPVFCIGVKFVASNYKQNANNYFENMMGETANIQANANVPYAQILILRHKTPYLDKNKSVKKIEEINDNDIKKYLKLFFDIHHAHRPRYIGIFIIDIDKTNKIAPTNIDEFFSLEVANLLKNKVSLSTFFKDISEYKDYYLITASDNG